MKPSDLDKALNEPAANSEVIVRILMRYFGFLRREAAKMVCRHNGIFEARGTESALNTAKAIITAEASRVQL